MEHVWTDRGDGGHHFRTDRPFNFGKVFGVTSGTRDAWDRGEAVREAGLPWTSLGRYEMRPKGPGMIVPMDMLRDITQSGVVGDATKARLETGEKMVSVLIPSIVQVCRELAGKE